MKLFLDTNVVVDALVDRNSHHAGARLLLALGKLGEFDLWVSPTQWTDLFYILSEGGKRSRAAMASSLLNELRSGVRISTVGETEIDSAMALGWPDMEDAVVHEAARATNPVALITNNKKDFAQSTLPTYTCAEFFAWLEGERGLSYKEIALS